MKYKHLIALLQLRGDINPELIEKVEYNTAYDVFDVLAIYFKDGTKRHYGSVELLELVAEFSIKTSSEFNHIANHL